MAKYIVDLDSFKECLDFLSLGKLNGEDYTYIHNIKIFIDRFPKEEHIENANVYRGTTEDIIEGRWLKPLGE